MVDLDKNADLIVQRSLEQVDVDVMTSKELLEGDVNTQFYSILEKVEKLPKHSPYESQLPITHIVDVRKFIEYDDEEFIEMMYAYILRRPADASGIETYMNVLKSKSMSKSDIIYNLAQSDEAKNLKIKVTGFEIMPLDWFVKYEDREFIENAFVLILGREPDDIGMDSFLSELRSAYSSKVEVLWKIVKSDEAALRNVSIYGLDKAVSRRKLKRHMLKMPVFGKGMRFLLKTKHSSEHTNWLMDKIGQKDKQISDLSELVNTQFQRINSLEQQLANINYVVHEKAAKNATEISEILVSVEKDRELIEFNQKKIELELQRLDLFEERGVSFENDLNQIRSCVSAYDHSIQSFGKFASEVGPNVNEINSALERYDTIVREYKNEDKKNLDMLLVGYSNIKADVDRLINDEGQSSHVVKNMTDGASAESQSSVEHSNKYEAIDYFDFENHFRGSREYIKKVQTMYIPYFEGRKHVVDLGCGRGEFTEMLTEHGVGVIGIDQYAPYVEYMRMLGLPVKLGDAVEYLRQQECVDGIFVGQVVEHISVGQIIELCKVAFEKLEKGAYLIMETPNPTSLAIYTNSFYMDPSHEKPVHPQTLKYLAEKAGFKDVEILFTQSSRLPYKIPKLSINNENLDEFNDAMDRISELLYGSQDYSIIARK